MGDFTDGKMFVNSYPASNYTHYPTYDWTPYSEGLTMIRVNQTLIAQNQKFIEICDPMNSSDLSERIKVCDVPSFDSGQFLEVTLQEKSDNCSDMDIWNPKEHICLVDPQPNKGRCKFENGSPAFYVDQEDNPICLQGIVTKREARECPKSIAVNVSLYRDWINQFIDDTGAKSYSNIYAVFSSKLLAMICAVKMLLV